LPGGRARSTYRLHHHEPRHPRPVRRRRGVAGLRPPAGRRRPRGPEGTPAMRRRAILAAAALTPAASLARGFGPALAAPRPTGGGGDGRLVYSTPDQADLLPRYVARLRPAVESGLRPSPEWPLYPGAVVLAARNGVIVEHAAV